MTDRSCLRGVAAVARSAGRFDRFWVGPDRVLMHAALRDGVWAAAEDLGGQLASVPAVTTWAEEPMEVFRDLRRWSAVGSLLGR